MAAVNRCFAQRVVSDCDGLRCLQMIGELLEALRQSRLGERDKRANLLKSKAAASASKQSSASEYGRYSAGAPPHAASLWHARTHAQVGRYPGS